MSFEKHRLLIQRLLEKTKNGTIDWSPSIDNNVFQASFRESSLLIREDASDLGIGDDYTIVLINEDGQVAESFSDVTLRRDTNDAWFYQNMKELFVAARRAALGAEKVMDSILDELEDDIDIPF